MTTAAIIKEISKLPMTEKLLLVEKTLKAIRHEKEQVMEQSVHLLYDDYKTDKDLIAFTRLDAASFYEAR